MRKYSKEENLYGLFYILFCVKQYQEFYENRIYSIDELLSLIDEEDLKFYRDFGWARHNKPIGFNVCDFCERYGLRCAYKKDELRIMMVHGKPEDSLVIKEAVRHNDVFDKLIT